MHSDLRTTPQSICSVGMTVDGREITEQHIDDMVETYNYSKYAARINLDHNAEQSGWAAEVLYSIKLNGGMLGDVFSLSKGTNSEGVTCLYAVLIPNASLLALNQADQAVFYSVEIDFDFMSSGKAYLVGLAMTDFPACAYTTRAHYTSRKKGDRLSNFTLNLAIPSGIGESKPPTKFSFKNLFKQDDDMTHEQLVSALKESISEPLSNFQSAIAEQTKLINSFSKMLKLDSELPSEGLDSDEKETFTKQAESRFNKLDSDLNGIQDGIAKLSALIAEAAGLESARVTDSDEEHNASDEFNNGGKPFI